MKRYDWTKRLFDVVAAHKHATFAWGKHDCCLFAARCVDAMCETNYEAALKKKYKGQRSAAKYIASFGSIEAAVKSWLGNSQKAAFTQRGDVVLFDNEGQQALGICLGREIISTGETGLVSVSMDKAICSWAVR
jgi:uncharacterized protein YfaT (DUF1175 family)